MSTFNSVSSAVFTPLLGWFGTWSAWIDILLWSVIAGVLALVVYKFASNQKGIERTKNGIKVHLLEIRLFQDDLLGVIVNTGKIILKNVLYIGHQLVPVAIMFVPFMAMVFQLVGAYGNAPLPVGSHQVLKVTVDRSVTDLPASQVRLALPDGVVLDAPPVPVGDEIAFRLRLDEPGDHLLQLELGNVAVSKTLAVGGELRRAPVMRSKTWDALLYPGEEGLPSDCPLRDIRVAYPESDLGWMPGGGLGIMLTFVVVSILAAVALKGVFGVTL